MGCNLSLSYSTGDLPVTASSNEFKKLSELEFYRMVVNLDTFYLQDFSLSTLFENRHFYPKYLKIGSTWIITIPSIWLFG